jgi:hypothetical protein
MNLAKENSQRVDAVVLSPDSKRKLLSWKSFSSVTIFSNHGELCSSPPLGGELEMATMNATTITAAPIPAKEEISGMLMGWRTLGGAAGIFGETLAGTLSEPAELKTCCMMQPPKKNCLGAKGLFLAKRPYLIL